MKSGEKKKFFFALMTSDKFWAKRLTINPDVTWHKRNTQCFALPKNARFFPISPRIKHGENSCKKILISTVLFFALLILANTRLINYALLNILYLEILRKYFDLSEFH